MKKALIAVVALLTAGGLLVFGWETYPAFAGDSPVFMPTAIQLAAGEGWANGVHPFLYPAPLFPMVVSWLMPDPTPADAFFVVSVFSALNVLLCGVLFYRAATWGARALDWYDTLLIVASLGGIATWLVPENARPEGFASLLVLGSVIAFLYWKALRWRSAWLWLLFSILLSVMAASNPNGAALFGLLALALCALRHRGAPWWRNVAVVLSVPLLALCATLLLYPGRAVPMLGSTLAVGRSLLTQRYLINPQYSVFRYYVIGPQAFCYGFVLLFALAGGMHLLYRQWERVASPRWFAFFLALFLLFAYYTAVRQPNRRYNLLLFASLFFALGIHYVSYLKAQGFPLAKGVQVAYVVLVITASAGFVRNVAMFPSYLRHGVSLEQARTALDESHVLDEAGRDEVIVTRATWALSQRYDKLQFCSNLRRCGEGAKWFLQQQQFSGRKRPRKRVGGYVLKDNFFAPSVPRLFGLKIANSMRGYSFAIYEKEKRPSRATRKRDRPSAAGLFRETLRGAPPDTTGARQRPR